MKTIVISLTSEHQRRNSVSTQLMAANIPFEFLDAIDLREKLEFTPPSLDSSSTSLNRSMTKGEYGCSASHIAAYQMISLGNDETALIIEDDAIIDNQLIWQALALATQHQGNWDIIILGYSKLQHDEADLFYKKEPIKVFCKNDIISMGVPWKNWTCGTVGYLISKRAAEKLGGMEIATVADDWSFFEKKYNLRIYHTRPCVIFEDFQNFQSSIENERNTFKSSERALITMLRLIRGKIRSCMLDIKFFLDNNNSKK